MRCPIHFTLVGRVIWANHTSTPRMAHHRVFCFRSQQWLQVFRRERWWMKPLDDRESDWDLAVWEIIYFPLLGASYTQAPLNPFHGQTPRNIYADVTWNDEGRFAREKWFYMPMYLHNKNTIIDWQITVKQFYDSLVSCACLSFPLFQGHHSVQSAHH